jgi:hypothetical protein
MEINCKSGDELLDAMDVVYANLLPGQTLWACSLGNGAVEYYGTEPCLNCRKAHLGKGWPIVVRSHFAWHESARAMSTTLTSDNLTQLPEHGICKDCHEF